MSRFIGPIHHWLYNKINILEDIEKDIIKAIVPKDEQKKILEDLTSEVGPYLNRASLEETVDQDNIHGWLQAKIYTAERRQSALFFRLHIQDEPSLWATAEKIYARWGETLGKKFEAKESISAEEIFKGLDDVLLEGMPCDRVNAIKENSQMALIWEKVRCVHEKAWIDGKTPVSVYYDMRTAFSKAFVCAVSPKFTYTFEMSGTTQLHKVLKEATK